jgi:hypothetical protein
MNEAVVVTEWYVVPEEAAGARRRSAPTKTTASLGAATAGPLWGWSDAKASAPRWHGLRPLGTRGTTALFESPRPAAIQPATQPAARHTAPVVLRIAPVVLRAMSLAATLTGRDEREIWTEAAREWLDRHLEDDPEPPEPGATAPVRCAERATRLHTWTAIDVLLRDLRAPLPETEDEPAA